MMEQIYNNINQWVSERGQNNIVQHSDDWKAAKKYTIGGSSIATIQNKNRYKTMREFLIERVFGGFESNIKMQWGNLFEELVKQYVEYDLDCKILGEDLYVEGPDGCAYSPDGITVIKRTHEDDPKIALVEFKCPYSRIPSKNIPDYYVPQIKMGMDLLQIPEIGLFVEAVFRRCAWDQLGDNILYNKDPVDRPARPPLPLAYGFIGFYSTVYTKKHDIGTMPSDEFEKLMDLYDKKQINVWYSDMAFTKNIPRPDIYTERTNTGVSELVGVEVLFQCRDEFEAFCTENKYNNIGMLPYKLFRVYYHLEEKEPEYLSQWVGKIKEVVELLKKCGDAESTREKMEFIDQYTLTVDDF